MTDDPNILLIILDSVRAQNTPLYGYDRETTPELARFAERATHYKKAWAPGVGSPQSHTSLFTGQHVVKYELNSVNVELTAETIWDELREDGYETGVFSFNPYLTQIPSGLRSPFDHVFDGNQRNLPFPAAPSTARLNASGFGAYRRFLSRALASDYPLGALANGVAIQVDNASWLPYTLERESDQSAVDAFLEWEGNQTGSWAACINLMGAHTPYVPADAYHEWATPEERRLASELGNHVWQFLAAERPLSELGSLGNVYDECIRQVDAAVGQILRTLERQGTLKNTLVVVTADHGESFGEQGGIQDQPAVGHGATGVPRESVLRVPLVVKFPVQTEPTVVEAPASLTQFPAAVRAARSGDWHHEAFVPDGPVLASTFGLSPSEQRAKPEYVDDLSAYDRPTKVVYQQEEKSVHKHITYGDESFTLDVTDPQQSTIVATGEVPARVVETAFKSVHTVDEPRRAEEVAIDEEVTQRLEELGYR